jgi:hypothetical protein
MMNQWDRDRISRGAQQEADHFPGSGGGWVWLVAVLLAVLGLALFARHGSNNLVMIPVGISLFFMLMFLFSYRRESRRLQSLRETQRLTAPDFEPQPMGMLPPPAASDGTLRCLFDRFDLKVIDHGRRNEWEPRQISSLLEMARDFVDTPHAGALLNAGEKDELDRHLDAALERALLQFDVANERKGDKKRPYHHSDYDVPF